MDLLNDIYDPKYVINLLHGNYVDKISQFSKELPKGQKLNVIIAGGDGTISSLIEEFQQKVADYDRLVFVPFPLGLGNDFSLHLNFGGNMDVFYIHKFFEKLNSS